LPMSISVRLSSNTTSNERFFAIISAVWLARSIGLEYIADMSRGLRYFAICSACSIPVLV